jgi:hypothetical protein
MGDMRGDGEKSFDGINYLRCLTCGAPLTAQLQAHGYCRKCSAGDDEEAF